MSLAESASDETLFNNQAGILCSRVDNKLPWPPVMCCSNIWFWVKRATDSNCGMKPKAPYVCYSGQCSTAFTVNTLPQAPNYGMNAAHTRARARAHTHTHTHTHTLHINYKQIEPQTDEAYGGATNTVLTREQEFLIAARSRIPFYWDIQRSDPAKSVMLWRSVFNCQVLELRTLDFRRRRN